MPIVIRNFEPERVEIRGTTFLVNRITYAQNRALLTKHTVAGQLDEEQYGRARWGVVLAGWEHLHGPDGEIPYAKEAAPDVGEDLPQEVATLLLTVAMAPSLAAAESLGN